MVFNWKVKVRTDMHTLNSLWPDRPFTIHSNDTVDTASMYQRFKTYPNLLYFVYRHFTPTKLSWIRPASVNIN